MTTNEAGIIKGEVPKPWYAAYPVQRSAAATVTREALLSWMEKGKVAGKDFVLVDLRRTDFEVRYFAYNTLNVPARSNTILNDAAC
jgi:arsenical-resistance protein 2